MKKIAFSFAMVLISFQGFATSFDDDGVISTTTSNSRTQSAIVVARGTYQGVVKKNLEKLLETCDSTKSEISKQNELAYKKLEETKKSESSRVTQTLEPVIDSKSTTNVVSKSETKKSDKKSGPAAVASSSKKTTSSIGENLGTSTSAIGQSEMGSVDDVQNSNSSITSATTHRANQNTKGLGRAIDKNIQDLEKVISDRAARSGQNHSQFQNSDNSYTNNDTSQSRVGNTTAAQNTTSTSQNVATNSASDQRPVTANQVAQQNLPDSKNNKSATSGDTQSENSRAGRGIASIADGNAPSTAPKNSERKAEGIDLDSQAEKKLAKELEAYTKNLALDSDAESKLFVKNSDGIIIDGDYLESILKNKDDLKKILASVFKRANGLGLPNNIKIKMGEKLYSFNLIFNAEKSLIGYRSNDPALNTNRLNKFFSNLSLIISNKL